MAKTASRPGGPRSATSTAAGRWLASEGIADGNRIAIVGWSYGGYAALQAAATDPSQFKAVVAVAPVADLEMFKKEARHYDTVRVVESFIGSGAHVTEGSPLRNAKAISAPVLLVHGDMDANVGIAHSREMAEKLREGGKSVELLQFEGLDHQLEDSNARAQMLTKVAQIARTHNRQIEKGGRDGPPFRIRETPTISASRTRSRGSAPSAPDRGPRRAWARG